MADVPQSTMRKVDVNLHDTSFGIWQDNANDPTFRAEIYGGLIRLLRRHGWTVGQDPQIHRRHRILSPDHRLAHRGDLRAKIRVSGRVVEMEVWAETWPIDNHNGRQYDFDKRKRMGFLDGLRLDLDRRRIIAWLETIATVTVKNRDRAELGPGGSTAMRSIERSWSESRHKDEALGRPVCRTEAYRRSGDGHLIQDGQTVWFKDRKGRICRGRAFYHINNMWFVEAGRYTLRNQACFELFCEQPDDLRRKRNGRERRKRIEAELTKAMRADAFGRADTLRRILFGEAPTFRIWSKKRDAYYGPDYSGYTSDFIAAGRYTFDEVERHVRSHEDILVAIGPDGLRVNFGAERAAEAA